MLVFACHSERSLRSEESQTTDNRCKEFAGHNTRRALRKSASAPPSSPSPAAKRGGRDRQKRCPALVLPLPRNRLRRGFFWFPLPFCAMGGGLGRVCSYLRRAFPASLSSLGPSTPRLVCRAAGDLPPAPSRILRSGQYPRRPASATQASPRFLRREERQLR